MRKTKPDKVYGGGKRNAEKTGSDAHKLPEDEQRSYGASDGRIARPQQKYGVLGGRRFTSGLSRRDVKP